MATFFCTNCGERMCNSSNDNLFEHYLIKTNTDYLEEKKYDKIVERVNEEYKEKRKDPELGDDYKNVDTWFDICFELGQDAWICPKCKTMFVFKRNSNELESVYKIDNSWKRKGDDNSKCRIYLVHSTDMDYVGELYEPLKNSDILSKCDVVFPHKNSEMINNTREDYSEVDIIIAECSKPSMGVGIELGWFYDEKKPIYCFYKKGVKPSSALKVVAKKIVEYENKQDFVDKIKAIIERY